MTPAKPRYVVRPSELDSYSLVLQLSTPEEFGAFLRAEVATWAKVVQDSGARVE